MSIKTRVGVGLASFYLVFLLGLVFFVRFIFLLWFEVKVEADEARLFDGEISIDFGLSVGIKFGNTAGDGVAIDVLFGGFDEWVDIANFGDDFGGVSVLFGLVAVIGRGSALEIAESISESVVTTTENPVDNLAFGHSIEVVETEAILGDHRT